MKIKKNDLVEVIAGKDKGARGKVIHAYPRKGKVLVEGVNRVTKHTKVQTSRRGDRVSLMETRPLSATKRWRVVEILEKAK